MASSGRVAAIAARRARALDEARAAWDAGDYGRVAQIAADARPDRREDRVATALLHARALLALDRPGEVVALLKRLTETKGADEVAETAMLLGAALSRTGRRRASQASLDTAESVAKRGAARLLPEIAYYQALSRWSAFELEAAEGLIDAALPDAAGAVRARLLQLLGWIDVRRENYGAAARAFSASLAALDESGASDVQGRARALRGMANIAAETIDLRLGRLARRAHDALRWPDGARVEQFHTLDSLAWLSLLEGNLTRAWDERQLALTLSADTSYHAFALIDAGTVAGIVGDRFAERRYLDLAGALLTRGDQVGLDVEHRIAMLYFAAAAPAADVATARTVFTLYERTRPRETAMLAFEGDRRVDAYEAFAAGKLALAEGRTRDGIALLERALDLWSRLGYRLRVAIAANALRSATGEQRYAAIALDALRNAPDAWLRGSLALRSGSDDPVAQLTPAERRVLAELVKGKRSREIAATFGRSFNTINNHTRAVFSAFGVRSRAALVAKCAQMGILADVAERA